MWRLAKGFLTFKFRISIGVTVRVGMSVADLVSPVGEYDCLQGEYDIGMVGYIFRSSMDETVEDKEGNEYHSVVVQLPPAHEQLRAFASTKRMA